MQRALPRTACWRPARRPTPRCRRRNGHVLTACCARAVSTQPTLAFKPVLLATMLTMAEYTRLGYRADLSSEAWLAQTARAKGMRILDSNRWTPAVALDRLAEPERWRFLDEMMGTIVSGAQRTEAQAMVRAWSTADRAALDAIAARCEADASVSGRFVNQVLLKERNAGLAEGCCTAAQERKTFAAIGVLHLLGNGSVPACCRNRACRWKVFIEPGLPQGRPSCT